MRKIFSILILWALLNCSSCSTIQKIDLSFKEAQGYILPANACKITMRGITNEVADTIKFEGRDNGWQLHMTLDDTGSYISEKHSNRINAPWYKVKVKGRNLILRVDANTGSEREIIIFLSRPDYDGAFGPKITQAACPVVHGNK